VNNKGQDITRIIFQGCKNKTTLFACEISVENSSWKSTTPTDGSSARPLSFLTALEAHMNHDFAEYACYQLENYQRRNFM
jgi:hypothetical protein